MSGVPSVIRRRMLPFEEQYSTIPNAWLRDDRLSYMARGLLGVLLSHADGFEISIKDLADGSWKEKREAVMNGLKELRAYGYLVMHKTRSRAGTFVTEYQLQTPPADLLIHKLGTGSAKPTRTANRSARPTDNRSAKPTSIEKIIREETTNETPYSAGNESSAFWAELCTTTNERHRRRRFDGICADCFDSPEKQLDRAAAAAPNRKEGAA